MRRDPRNSIGACMDIKRGDLEVTLLYPPDESIPDPLPQVAGLTPRGSLVVVDDVPMDGLPEETLKKAQTIRVEGERETIHEDDMKTCKSNENLSLDLIPVRLQ